MSLRPARHLSNPVIDGSHAMPISYRAEPMASRERLIWSRITGT